MGEWQPIETASKAENELILVFMPTAYRGAGTCEVVTWFDGAWYSQGLGAVHPTHWMPLPEFPK